MLLQLVFAVSTCEGCKHKHKHKPINTHTQSHTHSSFNCTRALYSHVALSHGMRIATFDQRHVNYMGFLLPARHPRTGLGVAPDKGRGHECQRLDLTLTCRCVETLLLCCPYRASFHTVRAVCRSFSGSYLFNLKAMFCLCFVSLLCLGFCVYVCHHAAGDFSYNFLWGISGI